MNNSESSKQIKWGAVLSYGQMALSIAISLFYTPVMIRMLGQNEYGLYNTVASTLSMLSILSLGFNSSYVRFYSSYKTEGRVDDVKRLNGLYLIVFSVIGFVALVCGLFLTFNLGLVFDKGLTSQEYDTARILMLMMTINLALEFPMSVFNSIISAQERFIFLKVLGMITTVISPLVTLPLLLLGFRSIAIVSVTVALAFVVYIIRLYYAFRVLKVGFAFSHFEKGLFFRIFGFSFFIVINIVVDQINNNIDKVLLARFVGTAEVAVYSVGAALFSYYLLFSTSISGVFVPRIHNIVNETKNDNVLQRKRLTELFVQVGRIQFLILSLILSGVVIFGHSFIVNIWAGDGYGNAYFVALLLMIPSIIPLTQNTGIEIQRAKNLHQFRSIIYFFMALLNLGVSIFLCQLYGAIGAVIGTALSTIISAIIIMNIFYHKKCNINILEYWKNILKMMLGMLLPFGFGALIIIYVDLSNILMMITFIILYTLVYLICVWKFSLNNYEKELMFSPIRRIKTNRKEKN